MQERLCVGVSCFFLNNLFKTEQNEKFGKFDHALNFAFRLLDK